MNNDANAVILIVITLAGIYTMGIVCGWAILDRVYTSDLCEKICVNTSKYVKCEKNSWSSALAKVKKLRNE